MPAADVTAALPEVVLDGLTDAVGADHVLTGDAISDDYTHDECLSVAPQRPAAVVRPADAAEVAEVLRVAGEHRVPVTARGSASGMSGACVPVPGGLVVSFERMARVLEIDRDNAAAVVQPGVTLAALAQALDGSGLTYQVHPGEDSASLGGNVATNAGGMRAIKYGVTRNNVLGLEAVLPSGEVIRTGGKVVKTSTAYDLTQLIVGSEGTLALVTEVTLRLHPRAPHSSTVLAPFATLGEVSRAVARIAGSGVGPLLLEYVDAFTMAAITGAADLSLGVPDEVRERAEAYLVVVLESTHEGRLEEDLGVLADLLADELGAMDVYVLPTDSARKLIEAREKAFWTAKAAGADDIVDIVVPRASIPEFFDKVRPIADEHGSFVVGCGHAGDGNVHLAIFQKDPDKRYRTLRALFEHGLSLGGSIAGEHGLGRAKLKYFRELEDPAKVALLARIKAAFDPAGILNPGVVVPSEATREGGAA